MKKAATRKPAKALRPMPAAVRKRVGGIAGKDAPGIVDDSEPLSDLRCLIQAARQRVASVACWRRAQNRHLASE